MQCQQLHLHNGCDMMGSKKEGKRKQSNDCCSCTMWALRWCVCFSYATTKTPWMLNGVSFACVDGTPQTMCEFPDTSPLWVSEGRMASQTSGRPSCHHHHQQHTEHSRDHHVIILNIINHQSSSSSSWSLYPGSTATGVWEMQSWTFSTWEGGWFVVALCFSGRRSFAKIFVIIKHKQLLTGLCIWWYQA